MKGLLLSLLVGGLPNWLPSLVMAGGEGEGAKKQCIVVTSADVRMGGADVTEDGEARAMLLVVDTEGVVELNGEDGESVKVFVTATAGDEGSPGEVKIQRIKLRTVSEHDPDRGWLGVSIGSVTDTLAAQIDVEDQGVVVLNVVVGSPAEDAGLQVHDIVLSVNGEVIEGEDVVQRVSRLVKMIGAHNPGEAVELAVVRGGRTITVSAELGSRPATAAITWKAEWEPETVVEEKIHTIGKMLHRGPDGEWILESLGDLEGMGDLPCNIRKLFPKSGTSSTRITVDGNSTSIRCTIKRDGEVLTVEQEDGGQIIVKRIDADGDETTATYTDKEKLLEADEEAYELLNSSSGYSVIHLNIEGIEALEDIDIDLRDLKGHAFQWKMELEDSLQEAGEAYETAMEQIEELMEQWKSTGKGTPHVLRGIPGLPSLPGLLHMSKPKHQFELGEDGSIEIRIRKGDSELVQLYSDEDDLAKRNPRLYAKYRDLMDAD